MLKHIHSGFSGRATRRPAKSARPARVAPGLALRVVANLARCAASRFGPRLAAGLSPEATALLQFGPIPLLIEPGEADAS